MLAHLQRVCVVPHWFSSCLRFPSPGRREREREKKNRKTNGSTGVRQTCMAIHFMAKFCFGFLFKQGSIWGSQNSMINLFQSTFHKQQQQKKKQDKQHKGAVINYILLCVLSWTISFQSLKWGITDLHIWADNHRGMVAIMCLYRNMDKRIFCIPTVPASLHPCVASPPGTVAGRPRPGSWSHPRPILSPYSLSPWKQTCSDHMAVVWLHFSENNP